MESAGDAGTWGLVRGQRSEVSVLGDATRPLVLHVVSALERKLLQAVLQQRASGVRKPWTVQLLALASFHLLL